MSLRLRYAKIVILFNLLCIIALTHRQEDIWDIVGYKVMLHVYMYFFFFRNRRDDEILNCTEFTVDKWHCRFSPLNQILVDTDKVFRLMDYFCTHYESNIFIIRS